jgi:hypothetical protein
LGSELDVYKKKKRKSKSKSKDETGNGADMEEEGDEVFLADVQLKKPFVLASSKNPATMKPAEWPLLLKVFA